MQVCLHDFSNNCSFSGELWQERDRASAVCQKEQAKPSHLEQTARRNEETGQAEGKNCFLLCRAQKHYSWIDQVNVTYNVLYCICTPGGNQEETQDDHHGVCSARERTPLHCRRLTSIRITDEARHWNPVTVRHHTHTISHLIMHHWDLMAI